MIEVKTKIQMSDGKVAIHVVRCDSMHQDPLIPHLVILVRPQGVKESHIQLAHTVEQWSVPKETIVGWSVVAYQPEAQG
jgi:hypothetical protein